MRSRIRRLADYASGDGLGGFLIRAVAGSGAVQLAGLLVTFLVGIQLARGLGVDGYGYYGIAMAVIALISIPGEFGLPQLVTREVAAASAHQNLPRLFGVIRWANRTVIMIAIPAAAIAALAAVLLLDERSSPVALAIVLGAPIIPLVALTKVRGSALQGLHQVVLGQVPFILLRPLLFAMFLLALFALVPEAGAPEAMALNAITAAAALVFSHIWLRNRLPRPKPDQLVQTGRSWLASSIPMALTEGMRVLQSQLLVLLLGILVTAEQVGLFRVAVSTAVMVAIPISMINRVTAPVIAKLVAEADTRRLQRVCTHSAQLMAAAVLALTLPLLLWGAELLSIVFGRAFAPAAPALLLMCAGFLANAAFGPNATLLTMAGHERRVTRAIFIGVSITLLLAITLVPIWHGVGAAIAIAFSALVWNLLLWRDARRLLGIDTSLLPVSAILPDGKGT